MAPITNSVWVKKNSWKEKLADELHKPIKRKFPRRSVIVFSKGEIWSADLTIGLDSYSRQFIYLDLIWIYISVFVSTAYLKFTKFQYVFLLLSLQGHYRVTDED